MKIKIPPTSFHFNSILDNKGKLMNINIQLKGKDFNNSDFFSWAAMSD